MAIESLKPISILIVEDNSVDIILVEEIFKESKVLNTLKKAMDGEEAISFLRKEPPYQNEELPDIILLDLRMPKKDGFEVLEDLKNDPILKHIPVIIMSISKDEVDILKSYNLHANAYVVKPVQIDQFINAVKSIEEFWLTIVKLPKLSY